jgi:hypothetical protein
MSNNVLNNIIVPYIEDISTYPEKITIPIWVFVKPLLHLRQFVTLVASFITTSFY